MTVYTKHDSTVIVIPGSGKELHLVKDALNSQKIIVQVYGPNGGLHGTARVDLSDFRAGLLLAGVGTKREAR